MAIEVLEVAIPELPSPKLLRPDLPSIPDLQKLFHYSVITGELVSLGLTPQGKTRKVKQHNAGYLAVTVNNKQLLAHRIIWAIVTGEWPDTIDHINGDRKDNRWLNLRSVAKADNNRNTAGWSRSKSGVKGVYPARAKGRWVAKITVDLKSRVLGTFNSKEEAVAAYNAAALLHYGEFARCSKEIK